MAYAICTSSPSFPSKDQHQPYNNPNQPLPSIPIYHPSTYSRLYTISQPCLVRISSPSQLQKLTSPSSRLLQSPRSPIHRHTTPNPRSLQKSRPKTPPGSRPLRLPRTRRQNKEIPSHKRRILHPLRPHPSPRLRCHPQLPQLHIGSSHRPR